LIRQWWVKRMVRRAKQCLGAEEWAAAAEFAAEVVRMDGTNIPARMVLGMTCLKDENYDGAADWFGSILEIEPEHVEAKSHLAMAYARAKRWDKAMATVEELAGNKKERPDRTQPAQAPRVQPRQATRTMAARSLGDILKAHDWPALKTAADAALAENPANPNAMLQLGMALYRMGKPEQSLAVYDKALAALKRDTDKAVVNFNRAMVLMQLGRWSEAGKVFEGLALTPPEARGKLREEAVLYNLGYCYSQRKMFKMAQSTYERLERIDPEYKDVSRCLKNLRVPLGVKARETEAAGATCETCSRPMPLGATFCGHCGWRAESEEQLAISLEA